MSGLRGISLPPNRGAWQLAIPTQDESIVRCALVQLSEYVFVGRISLDYVAHKQNMSTAIRSEPASAAVAAELDYSRAGEIDAQVLKVV